MAEALGLASSIITVIELSAKAVKQCKHIIDTARDAPRDLRNILVEVSSLKAALENLDYLNKIDHDIAEEVSNQKGIGDAVHGCEDTLDNLIKQLGDLSIRDSQQTRPGKRAKIKAAIQWTWNETTARKLINDVLQHKTTITLGLLTQTSREVHEVKLAVLDVQKTVNDSKRYEICSWLQTTNPTNIHNTALKNHEIETGEWVFRLPQWKCWLQGETSHRFLWIYGIPGAGKTVLASHLLEQCQSYSNDSIGKLSFCVYYYCSYRNHQDETLPMIRWVVSQLIRKTEHMPSLLLADYENDHQPSFKTMKAALAELLVDVQTVYLLVDAVDESQPREELLLFLEELVTDPKFGRIQLLATSRRYHDITSVLTRLSHPISMSNEEVDKDIRKFVAARLEVKFMGWRAQYKAKILEVLVSKAQGMFRLAFCHVDIISRKRTELDMLNSLSSLPQTIEETYELILLEIDAQDWLYVRTILLWICGNDRLPGSAPIPVSTLISVLVRNGLACAISLPEEAKGFIEDICSCLLTVNLNEWSAEELSHNVYTANCAHYTVVEYLSSEQIKRSKVAYFALSDNDIITTFVCTALAVVETLNFDDLCADYWADFESYCARAVWLAMESLEPEFAQRATLWTSITKMWSIVPNFSQNLGTMYDTGYAGMPMVIAKDLAFEPVNHTNDLLAFAPGILASLISDYHFILADRLITHCGSQILDSPFHFEICDWTETLYGTALEATAFGLVNHGIAPVQIGIIEWLSKWFDNARIALFYVEMHAICCICRDDNRCETYTTMREEIKTDGSVQYCLTPLQLAVCCWDFYAVEALLELGADPNGLGASDGISTPVTVFQVDDRWWSASPLHIARHAVYAPEAIDEYFGMLEKRITKRSDLETILIEFGAQDFGSPTATKTSPVACAGSNGSCMDMQFLLNPQDESDASTSISP